MKELFERIIGYGPSSLAELAELISAPKRFLMQLELGSPEIVARALAFSISCLAMAFILRLPFVNGAKELWIVFALLIVVFFVTVLLAAAICTFSFSVVRGNGSFRDHLIATLYIYSPLSVLLSFIAAASKGIVLSEAFDLYPLFKEFMEYSMLGKSGFFDSNFDKFIPIVESRPVLVAIWLYVSALVFSYIWQIICWGGYRHINRVSRLKSFFAGIVALFLGLPISYVILFSGRGLGIDWF